MFGFQRRGAEQQQDSAAAAEEGGWLRRLRGGLGRTRGGMTRALRELFRGRRELDPQTLEELETILLSADVGVEASESILEDLSARAARRELEDGAALYAALRGVLRELLEPCSRPLRIPAAGETFVILMVGVNGAGKTTTIGKLARRFRQQGLSVMLAAGDTFRAAAVEQLQAWGERNEVPVIAQHSGADAAAVIYDAYAAAQARGIDVLIADTAGRLHSKSNLMEELKKIRRVLAKIDPAAPHEVMLVLDAGNGQNAISQAREFHAAMQVTGITLTKLDGTAKGGILFAIARTLGLPIRFIGVGEQAEDLREFDAETFVEALLGD